MTGPGLTRHAQARPQQRAIPPVIVELLERVGSAARANGADILFFDKAARKRLCRQIGGERALKPIERWLNVYVVVADGGSVLTAGRRYRRIQRDR